MRGSTAFSPWLACVPLFSWHETAASQASRQELLSPGSTLSTIYLPVDLTEQVLEPVAKPGPSLKRDDPSRASSSSLQWKLCITGARLGLGLDCVVPPSLLLASVHFVG